MYDLKENGCCAAGRASGTGSAERMRNKAGHEGIRSRSGGTKNSAWMQITSDILGKAVEIPAVTVGASYGDALMAASAVKYPGFETYDELLKYIKPGKTYYPCPDCNEKYEMYQQVYNNLYESTRELMHKLDEI